MAEEIPKSHEFERDLDNDPIDDRHDTLQFDENANEHFVYENVSDLLNTEQGKTDFLKMLDVFFNEQKERIEVLRGYSQGKNWTILNGRKRLEKEKADYRIAHNYGGYISDFVTGFILGNPLTIESTTENKNDIEDINDIHFGNDVDVLNYDLAYDVSRYGRAFELHYRTEVDGQQEDQIQLISPDEAFFIRTADVTKDVLAGVHCPIYNDKVHLTVYTDEQVIKYEPFKLESQTLEEQSRKKHLYGMVPMVEWWNNRYRIGDFEPGIPQIDAYDSAQSNTANYMSDLNDAMLVISGSLEASGLTAKDYITMKDANMMLLESGVTEDGKESRLTADYIYKQYDVAGTEKYKDRIVTDLFKLTNMPNLEEESFGTQSGIAIQYKLIGLRQIQATKENYFTKALRRRYKLIENVHKELYDTPIKANALNFTFHPNLPQNVWEEVDKYIENGGELSQETLRELASFTDNEQETKRLLEETQNRAIPVTPPRIEEGVEDGEEE